MCGSKWSRKHLQGINEGDTFSVSSHRFICATDDKIMMKIHKQVRNMAYFVFLLHETNAPLYVVINVNPVEKIRDNNKKKVFVSAQTKTMDETTTKKSDTIMPLNSDETALASN